MKIKEIIRLYEDMKAVDDFVSKHISEISDVEFNEFLNRTRSVVYKCRKILNEVDLSEIDTDN